MSEDESDFLKERIAREVALELCEATDKQRLEWFWPSDFNGDTIDRARACVDRILTIVAESTS